MITALSWIKEYVPDLDVSLQEYMDAMTLSGSKIEGYEELNKNLENIIVGQIKKIERHPDADKLIICQVDVGKTEPVQIVTGASNVKEGDKVPVVLDGGKVAGGHDGGSLPENGIKIKKGKLRGIESNGMMCSIEELGSSKDYYPDAPEEGIYIFQEDVLVGSDAVEVLGLNDTVFEYEITSNRVDCFSVLGIAREVAATFGKKYVPPVVTVKENEENVKDYVKVTVKDSDLCTRYCARVVKNINVGPSPEWMQRRLAAHGIRPINNLVDITNYIMEEFGQPMHAYDLDLIEGKEIIVKRGNIGDKFVTLDGQERSIDDSVLMICDSNKPVGIAGIMGGENSMITDSVSTLLFEAACFDGTNIRRSSKKVGLRTDASTKFEKGLDPNTAQLAIDRACQLIIELGVGEVVGGMVDIYDKKREGKTVVLDSKRINQILGTNIDEATMIGYLENIELAYNAETKEVMIPSWRQDISHIADLAEEVARFYGYDNIPTTLPTGEATTGKLSFKLRVEEVARNVAEFYGFCQAMTYAFESPKVFEKLLLPKDSKLREAVAITNPLGEDFSIMRTSSLNGMLTALSTNYNRRNKDVRLYELGNIYIPKQLPVTELPEERIQFTLGMYGEGDFFSMKGVVEEFLQKAGLSKKIKYNPSNKKSYLHPGRQAEMYYKEQLIGYLGEVHPEVSEIYNIKDRVYIAVIDMPYIVELATFDRKYEGIAKYPAVTRDISMVMKKEILVGQVEEIIEKKGGAILESYQLFDIYEGTQIKEGYKSVAYSITFRAKDKTLEDMDVNTSMERILKELGNLGIELRQ